MEKAIVSLSIPKKRKSPWEKPCQNKRFLTDKDSFKTLVILFSLCIAIPALIGLLLIIIDALKTLPGANRTRTNETFVNSSANAFYDAFSLAIDALTNDESLSHSFIFNLAIGSLSLLPMGILSFYYWNTLFTSMNLEISSAVDYSYHFAIISAGKIITILIFIIVMKFQWTDAPRPLDQYLKCFVIPELAIMIYNIKLFLFPDNIVNSENKNFKSTLRFYIGHFYLIIFKFLNYTAIVLLIAYTVIELYKIFPIYAYPFIMVVAYCVIYIIHYYGEMVIILARASRSWEQDEQAISMKRTLSAMMTISRYHIGTVISCVFGTRHLLRHYRIDDCALRRNVSSKKRFFIMTNGSCVMEHLIMFTAINGQDILKAAKNGRYFNSDNLLILPDFKNKPSAVWALMLFVSVLVLVLSILIEMSTSGAAIFITGVPILAYYIAVTSTYFYVFVSTMNTIENTIEFCRMMRNEDNKAELSKKLKILNADFAKASVDEVYEMEADEVMPNEDRPKKAKDLNVDLAAVSEDEIDETQDNEELGTRGRYKKTKTLKVTFATDPDRGGKMGYHEWLKKMKDLEASFVNSDVHEVEEQQDHKEMNVEEQFKTMKDSKVVFATSSKNGADENQGDEV